MPAIDPRNIEMMDPIMVEVLKRLSPKETLRQALESHELGRRLVESGVRTQYPDWSDKQIQIEILRRMHGDAVANAAASR